MDRKSVQYIHNDYNSLINEMREQNFEIIRFSSYRAACKLRFIQRKTNFHLIDIWNAIEAIRENGLHNHQDLFAEMNISRLETLVTSIYYQLSKRLPPSQPLNLDESITQLLTWLLAAYDENGKGKVKVFAIKIALAIICSGKLIDKLRYIFSLISDPSKGYLIENRFNAFLKESMALPCSVFETATFQYDDSLSSSIFDFSQPIDLYAFLGVFINANGPPLSISWIVILHRMADVEYVFHPIQCDACHRHSFNGFRYKCQKCFNYNLCQDCFWRGRTSGSHNADTHPCKEYAYWKSPSKQIGHSLRKSFRCIPSSNKSMIQFTEEPPREKRFNLTHIVPPSPVPSVHHYNGFNLGSTSSGLESLYGGSNSIYRSPPSTQVNNNVDTRFPEDEHRLIASYAASLAKYTKGLPANHEEQAEVHNDISQQQRIISQLETKNREIMKEIRRLRQEQQENEIRDNKLKSGSFYSTAAVVNQQDPVLLTELANLRERKEELEAHLSALQESRRELMVQLEGLMKLLKNHGNLLSIAGNGTGTGTGTNSASLNRNIGASPLLTSSSSTSMQSDLSVTSFSSSSVNRDLLVAADSVTNAMSSLVKELNSEDEAEELINDLKNNANISTEKEKVKNGKIEDDHEILIDEQKLKSRALAASVAFT